MSEIAQDGAVVWRALVQPVSGVSRAVNRQRALTAILVSTALVLLATALVLPHIDTEVVASSKLTPDMTVHEREQATEAATKLFRVSAWASAALGPVASVLAMAVALWLAFRVAGAPTAFRATLTVAAHAFVPTALKPLLSSPAAVVHSPVTPEGLNTLLPSNLAFVLPSGVPPPLAAAASAVDLFTLWGLTLACVGMTRAAGASRLRSTLVVLVLFLAWVALFKVVPAAMGQMSEGTP